MSRRTHRGSGFRDFLNEQGILGEVETRALKQAVSLQLGRLLKEKEISKAEMAARMKTSRAAVNRLSTRPTYRSLWIPSARRRASSGQNQNRVGAGVIHCQNWCSDLVDGLWTERTWAHKASL